VHNKDTGYRQEDSCRNLAVLEQKGADAQCLQACRDKVWGKRRARRIMQARQSAQCEAR
jgi:hypothetical protein